MSIRCSQCHAHTVWDDAVGSSVCTSCGSLVDPSQSVLTSADSVENPLWTDPATTTLKSLRSANNWDLSGQGKEARDRKNAAAMAEFIKSLAGSFNVPGLSPRAITLFQQAKGAVNFRWGTKSRSVAAACFAIALRESGRPDALRDIASVLEVAPTSVTREITRITSALGLSLTLIDPSVYIFNLQTYLSSTVHQQPLPSSLSKPLRILNFHAVANTAVSLSHLLVRLSPEHEVLRLPVPSTACAIFILALEAEHRAPLNPLGDLTNCLGGRLQVAKSVVMARYKIVQDQVSSWIECVPWLDKYENKGGRAKVSKRILVARGLKDVIQFQDDIWERRNKPPLPSDLLEESSDVEEAKTLSSQLPDQRLQLNRRSKPSRAVVQATRFLLDPLGTQATSSVPSSSLSPISPLSLATYMLTASPASISGRPPTRLQLLAALRGGADEDKIPDNDLFAEGELESLFRNDQEVRILGQMFGWSEDEENDVAIESHEAEIDLNCKRKRKRRETIEDILDVEDEITHGSALRLRKKRLDMEALSQFMAKDHCTVDESEGGWQVMGLEDAIDVEMDYELSERLSTKESPSPKRRQHSSTSVSVNSISPALVDQDSELILDDWRPPSPAINDSHYEEERPP